MQVYKYFQKEIVYGELSVILYINLYSIESYKYQGSLGPKDPMDKIKIFPTTSLCRTANNFLGQILRDPF